MRYRPPKRYAGETPLDAEETRRRGLVVRLASEAHASSQDALTFLNQPNARLGGRPLDIATASEAGFTAVRAELEAGVADA